MLDLLCSHGDRDSGDGDGDGDSDDIVDGYGDGDGDSGKVAEPILELLATFDVAESKITPQIADYNHIIFNT